jgi:hypothetical protein
VLLEEFEPLKEEGILVVNAEGTNVEKGRSDYTRRGRSKAGTLKGEVGTNMKENLKKKSTCEFE